MDILNHELKYKNQQEFDSLVNAIQENIDAGKLEKYTDQAWPRTTNDSWFGEYISHSEKKIFNLSGTNYVSTYGQPNYNGNWQVRRKELVNGESSIYYSYYQIRRFEPPIFADIEYEIVYTQGVKFSLNTSWANKWPQLIKSTIEYGIISAIEDCKPPVGAYSIIVRKIGFHHIDTSFSLLEFVANRNFKRALFLEHLDSNHRIESGQLLRKFRPIGTIGEFDL